MVETTGRQVIQGALIFLAIVMGSFYLISMSMPTITSDFMGYNQTINQFNTLANETEDFNDAIKDAKVEEGALGIANGLIGASWGALKLALGSVETFITVIVDTTTSFGVPVWFTGLITLIIMTTFIFALMAAWFKWVI